MYTRLFMLCMLISGLGNLKGSNFCTCMVWFWELIDERLIKVRSLWIFEEEKKNERTQLDLLTKVECLHPYLLSCLSCVWWNVAYTCFPIDEFLCGVIYLFFLLNYTWPHINDIEKFRDACLLFLGNVNIIVYSWCYFHAYVVYAK